MGIYGGWGVIGWGRGNVMERVDGFSRYFLVRSGKIKLQWVIFNILVEFHITSSMKRFSVGSDTIQAQPLKLCECVGVTCVCWVTIWIQEMIREGMYRVTRITCMCLGLLYWFRGKLGEGWVWVYLETRIFFIFWGGGMFASNAMEMYEAIFMKFSGLVGQN